jgi:subtilisin family serine protease
MIGALAAAALLVAASCAAAGKSEQLDTRDLLVKLRSGFGAQTVAADSDVSRWTEPGWRPVFDFAPSDSGEAERTGLARIFRIPLRPSVDAGTARAALSRLPQVEFAELDLPGGIFADQWMPDDPAFGLQWSLHNTGQNGCTADCDIDAPEAWYTERGDSSITVAVLDTGLDPYHPEFAGKARPGWDFANGDSNPQDDHGHGTHVSGIIAAWADNATGIAGAAPGVSLLPVKVVDDWGSGVPSTCAEAIVWAADHGANVINMSLGYEDGAQTLQAAIDYADALGVVVVAAMGNSGDERVYYPAGLEHVIAVGATDGDDGLAWFSTRGQHIDVSAPGVDVYSTMPYYFCTMTMYMGYSRHYDYCSGTSMAAPHAAALAALLLSAEPDLGPEEVESLMESGAEDRGPAGFDTGFGWGRINAQQSLAALMGREVSTPAGFLRPQWNWISFPLIPVDPDPTQTCGFDVSGRLCDFDRYCKATRVYKPPFSTFDLQVGRGYLLWLDAGQDAIAYRGFDPRTPVETRLGPRGWSWVGLPGSEEIPGAEFMQTVRVVYPSDSTGEIRTAAQDRLSGAPWLSWGWIFWDSATQSARAFTPYAPFGETVCRPWVGYRVYANVGTAAAQDDPDQVTLIWP